MSYHTGFTLRRFSGTLGILSPVPKGKMQPPWADQHFPGGFTGQPPVECYEDVMRDIESQANESVRYVPPPTDDEKREAPGDPDAPTELQQEFTF